MKAQVLCGIDELKYEENFPTPELKNDELLLKVKACGICGSDVDRVLKNGTYHFPTIIGHEFSGEVVKCLSEENNSYVGKRYSVFPLIPCKKCNSCLKGEYQLCEDYNYLGSRCDGGFSEYVAVPKWNLIEIPNGISFEEAAMLEPSAVALHALKMAGTILGKKVAITGTGTIASIMCQLAISAGASKVYVLGRNQLKLDYIKGICSEIIAINITDINADENLKKEVANYDVVIEGTGASEMISLSLNLCMRQGVIVLMGNPSSNIELGKKDYWHILRKELTVKGTWNSSYGVSDRSDWEKIFELLLGSKLNLKKLITHKLELSQLYDGIKLMKDKSVISNKIMVVL